MKAAHCSCSTPLFSLLVCALAGQVGVKLVLHVVRHLTGNGAALGIGHPLGKGSDEVNVLDHMLALHDGHGVVAVVDGGGVVGRDPGEGYGRDALVSEGVLQ